MTKEQALQILQEAIDRGIDPDEDVEIFDAIKIAIECLQSDPYAPDWSQAPEWAQWYAIDKNKTECWFENEPLCVRGVYFASSGKMDYCSKKLVQSLFKRPDQ